MTFVHVFIFSGLGNETAMAHHMKSNYPRQEDLKRSALQDDPKLQWNWQASWSCIQQGLGLTAVSKGNELPMSCCNQPSLLLTETTGPHFAFPPPTMENPVLSREEGWKPKAGGAADQESPGQLQLPGLSCAHLPPLPFRQASGQEVLGKFPLND